MVVALSRTCRISVLSVIPRLITHFYTACDAAIGVLSAELLHLVVDFATVPEPVWYEMWFFYKDARLVI